MNKIRSLKLNQIVFSALRISLILIANGFVVSSALALTYSIPDNGNVVGNYQTVRAREGDTLSAIAQRYDIGMYEIFRANPRLQNRRLYGGTPVVIPSRFTLPSGPRTGIVLNLADMRVFHYLGNGKVSTYPVGIGRSGWSTPVGTTQIINKVANPSWRPPESIRREAARKGKRLPTVVPPGPKNPLGRYALYLGFKRILMHGTNAPRTIGLRSSHGCIRLFSADIAELFQTTPVGTTVRIVYDPHRKSAK